MESVNNYITRPAYPDFSLSKHDTVLFQRERGAYDLAERKTGINKVTEEEKNKAYKLLNRVIRYGLRAARHAEYDNIENYYNKAWHKEEEKKLNVLYNKLNAELKVYNARIEFFGLYPTITDLTRRGVDLYVLHYFD